MKVLPCSLILSACLTLVQGAATISDCRAATASGSQLLSFTGIKLQPMESHSSGKGQYIASFNIRTWGVRVLAVCHIPPGWTLSAGKNANPEGELSGSAGEGVAFLDLQRLRELENLFLVQVDDYHSTDKGDCSKNCTPASFAGAFDVGEYGPDFNPLPHRLIPSNILLRAATRCPDPF